MLDNSPGPEGGRGRRPAVAFCPAGAPGPSPSQAGTEPLTSGSTARPRVLTTRTPVPGHPQPYRDG